MYLPYCPCLLLCFTLTDLRVCLFAPNWRLGFHLRFTSLACFFSVFVCFELPVSSLSSASLLFSRTLYLCVLLVFFVLSVVLCVGSLCLTRAVCVLRYSGLASFFLFVGSCCPVGVSCPLSICFWCQCWSFFVYSTFCLCCVAFMIFVGFSAFLGTHS